MIKSTFKTIHFFHNYKEKKPQLKMKYFSKVKLAMPPSHESLTPKIYLWLFKQANEEI